jgi:hypothetical protein
LNALDLREWGLKDTDKLHGAETAQIGQLVGEELTEEGVRYLREMLEDDANLTPYQQALHNFWEAAFSDYL